MKQYCHKENFIITKTGFSLLELVVVLIIVAVLTSIALPRFFRTIEYARIAEARLGIEYIRREMEKCANLSWGYGPCGFNTDPDPLGTPIAIDDPGASPGAHFTYRAKGLGGNNGGFIIQAERNAVDLFEDYEGAKIQLRQWIQDVFWCTSSEYQRFHNMQLCIDYL